MKPRVKFTPALDTRSFAEDRYPRIIPSIETSCRSFIFRAPRRTIKSYDRTAKVGRLLSARGTRPYLRFRDYRNRDYRRGLKFKCTALPRSGTMGEFKGGEVFLIVGTPDGS